jgi:hypothetical protein
MARRSASLRSRPRPFQRIQGCVHGRIALHASYASVVQREDAREAIRSSVTSEQYAVPDDEDPIEVTQTVTRERRNGEIQVVPTGFEPVSPP